MNTAKQIREPRADYLALEEPALLRGFELLATAEGGVAKLRELILSLAVRGQLVPQDAQDQSATKVLARIRAEKDRLVAKGMIKRDKPLPPVTKDETPFQIPESWRWFHLADICSVVTDGEHLTPQRTSDLNAVPLVTAKNVRDGYMDYAVTDFVSVEVAEKCWARCKPETLDVLMVSVGATLGRLSILRDPADMVLVRSVTVLRPIQHVISSDYLAWHLRSPDSQGEIWRSVKQSAQPCLYLAKSSALMIALPPLAEQHRIVARVEELMTLCDELEARGRLADEQHARLTTTLFGALTASDSAQTLTDNWQRIATHFDLLLDRPQAIDALEQTILQLAVRGLLVPQDASDEPASKLFSRVRAHRDRLIAKGELKRDKPLLAVTSDEVPFPSNKGWLWTRITEFCEVQGGIQKTPLRRPVKNHYPYLRVANVQRNALQLDEIERYELTDDEVEKWRLRSGDLLIVEGNGSEDEIGRCAIWDGSIDPCVFQNHLIRVRPDVASTVEFLKLFLNSPDGAAEMKRLAITTSGLFNLSVGKIRNIPVPLPPLAEQHRIVARVEQLRSLCDNLRERQNKVRATQTHLAEALVTEAVQPQRSVRLG